MKKSLTLNTVLAAVLGLALTVCALLRVFLPRLILPTLDGPNMVLICLVSLLLEHYFAPGEKRSWLISLPAAALTFGLLPWTASFAAGPEALLLAVTGGAVFAVTTWVFDSMTDRLSTGPAAKAAPIACALCLYLAAQGFMGIF